MKAVHRRRRLRLPRVEWLIGLTLIVVVVFLAALTVLVVRQSQDLRTANEARDALARQVQGLGEKPVAGPPGSRGDPGRSVTGPRGPQGSPGDAGEPGPTGASGRPGEDGRAGKTGASGADGAGGERGADGEAGASGADGAAGPPGPQGPQGEPGPAGPRGEPGPAGADGERGPAGPSCPDGYSLQPLADDPDALVCRRDGAPQPDPDGEPTPQAALDPSRRQY